MKESFYNHYIFQQNIVLLYNSFRDAYLMVKKEIFDHIFMEEKLSPKIVRKEYPHIYKTFVEQGFIVEDDFDEMGLCENIYHRRKFSKSDYHLTINPTLDCNLKCWYCYESHVKKSKMSDDTVNDIINHLIYKIQYEPFQTLQLSFFGGEPLLQPRCVIKIISEVKRLSNEYDFDFHIHFTSNGTVISKTLLETLTDCSASFQITFDGNKANHNSVRLLKNASSKGGSYELILKNIQQITDKLDKYKINVRINYSNDTFEQLDSLVNDLDFCDRKKVFFSLHKVWQVKSQSIDKTKLFDFICYAKNKKFKVDYLLLNNYRGTACYADNLNQVVINYNGDVFKCTARDFNDSNKVGVLSKEGLIIWDTDKLMDRMNLRIADQCKTCKLLPSCPGICSQKRLEMAKEEMCILDKGFTIDEYIIHNFNHKVLDAKIQAN